MCKEGREHNQGVHRGEGAHDAHASVSVLSNATLGNGEVGACTWGASRAWGPVVRVAVLDRLTSGRRLRVLIGAGSPPSFRPARALDATVPRASVQHPSQAVLAALRVSRPPTTLRRVGQAVRASARVLVAYPGRARVAVEVGTSANPVHPPQGGGAPAPGVVHARLLAP